jgi:6-pyruvoyltetrahydropterin/6-carboxytetrahydropterin synthase
VIIQKQYQFYAANRNEELSDKCRNLHGHRYGITCFFEVERTGALTTLFADFDDRIEPHLKREYDHGMLVNVNDPLFETLAGHTERTGEQFKLKLFEMPTTVENLAHQLFTEITEMGFRLQKIEVRETDSSVVSYTREDWVADNRFFANLQRAAKSAESLPIQTNVFFSVSG